MGFLNDTSLFLDLDYQLQRHLCLLDVKNAVYLASEKYLQYSYGMSLTSTTMRDGGKSSKE
jgi:hypothetical protein